MRQLFGSLKLYFFVYVTWCHDLLVELSFVVVNFPLPLVSTWTSPSLLC